ncbi:MAG TPA: single-stranded DNA-binding protein [Bacteroides sp.]|nr:single-stranded DNA-binding protein [Bacteroides sp.]
MSVNKVILVGNVGKDPETRYLDEGTAMTKFPLATSETYKNRDGEKVTTTEWHNVVLWRGLAQVAEKYVKKGTQLYIEGRIKTRSYDDSEGNKKYITEIVGDQMQMLGRKPDEEDSQHDRPQQAASPQAGSTHAGSTQAGQKQDTKGQGPGAQQDFSPGEQEDPFGGEEEGPDDLPF